MQQYKYTRKTDGRTVLRDEIDEELEQSDEWKREKVVHNSQMNPNEIETA